MNGGGGAATPPPAAKASSSKTVTDTIVGTHTHTIVGEEQQEHEEPTVFASP